MTRLLASTALLSPPRISFIPALLMALWLSLSSSSAANLLQCQPQVVPSPGIYPGPSILPIPGITHLHDSQTQTAPAFLPRCAREPPAAQAGTSPHTSTGELTIFPPELSLPAAVLVFGELDPFLPFLTPEAFFCPQTSSIYKLSFLSRGRLLNQLLSLCPPTAAPSQELLIKMATTHTFSPRLLFSGFTGKSSFLPPKSSHLVSSPD